MHRTQAVHHECEWKRGEEVAARTEVAAEASRHGGIDKNGLLMEVATEAAPDQPSPTASGLLLPWKEEPGPGALLTLE